jgi:ankyrin repeat protein
MLHALKNGYYKTNVQHKKTGETPLIIASQWGEEAIVKLLLVRRCKVDLADKHGNTALAKAAMYNQLNICKRLLKAGADVDITNDMGVSAAHRAAMYGHTEILKLLIDEYHAKYRPRDKANRQCLDYVKLYKHAEALKYLENVHKRPIEGKQYGIASQIDNLALNV